MALVDTVVVASVLGVDGGDECHAGPSGLAAARTATDFLHTATASIRTNGVEVGVTLEKRKPAAVNNAHQLLHHEDAAARADASPRAAA